MLLTTAALKKHIISRLFLLLVLFGVHTAPCRAQLSFDYIPGSNDFVFPAAAADSMTSLATHTAVFYGETHTTHFEPAFKFHFIRYLNTTYNTRNVFMEIGYSGAWLLNRYLQTGDTTLFDGPSLAYTGKGGYYRAFWRNLYAYNRSLPDDRKIVIHGVDFERTEVFKVLLMLLPEEAKIPAELQPVFDSIRLYSRDTTIALFSKNFIGKYRSTAAAINTHWAAAATLYGSNAGIVSSIIHNRGPQSTRVPARNRTMFDNMRQTLATEGIQRFVAFFGSAHTTYRNKHSLTSAVNRLSRFKGKVVHIKSVNYNVYNNRTKAYEPCTGIDNSKKASAMYKTYLSKPVRAVLIPTASNREADFLLMANDTTSSR